MINGGNVLGLVAAATVLIVVPGPGVLFIVSRGVSLGRRAALATGAGHATGLLVQMILVAAGVGALLERSQRVFDVLKLAGAVYLVYLGMQAFRHRHELALASNRAEAPRPARRMVRDGVVANPKGFVMCAALLPKLVDPTLGHPQLQLLILGSICVAIGLASDSTWGGSPGAPGCGSDARPGAWPPSAAPAVSPLSGSAFASRSGGTTDPLRTRADRRWRGSSTSRRGGPVLMPGATHRPTIWWRYPTSCARWSPRWSMLSGQRSNRCCHRWIGPIRWAVTGVASLTGCASADCSSGW
jgi:threonine/homoserine/homoserine lactone efflux protein